MNQEQKDIHESPYTKEMQAEMMRLADLLSDKPSVDFDSPITPAARLIDEEVNQVWNVGEMPPVAKVSRFVVPGDPSLGASSCEAVVFKPEAARQKGNIFFIHGGGWCVCSLTTHERFMRVLANVSGMNVIGVHYRLAPEHPFPSGLVDVISAFRKVTSAPTKYELNEGPFVLAGDSAGANLSLSLMLHELDTKNSLPVGSLLFYGCFGHDFNSPSYKDFADGHLLTTAIMKRLWEMYLPSTEFSNNPLAVPLEASDEQLMALPPLFLLAAEIDPLASDTYALKGRLERLGRKDKLHVEKGVVHGYLQMTAVLKAARTSTQLAAEAANQFVKNCLG